MNQTSQSRLAHPHLDTILHTTHYNGAMREAVRNYLRRWALARAQTQDHALTGTYYWVPRPADHPRKIRWELHTFYDSWRPSVDHAYVWRHVQDSLAYRWRRSFGEVDYASLPRGRVCRPLGKSSDRQHPPTPVIYHGADTLAACSLDTVRHWFRLPASSKAIFDEHEQMIAGQPEARGALLGGDLGLRGPDIVW